MKNQWQRHDWPKHRWLKSCGSAFALALTASACAMSQGERIDDSRLAGIPADQQQPITQAQQEIVRAQQDQAVAKEGQTDAETQLRMAKSELDVAQARFDQVKQQRDIELKSMHDQEAAQFKGAPLDAQAQAEPPPANQVQAAQPQQLVSPADFQQASTALEAAKAKVAYIAKLVDIAKTGSRLADRKLDLARSNLELARFQVLNTANPAEIEAMKINEAQFDADVSHKQAAVAEVQAKQAELRGQARENYNRWSGLDQQLSQMPNYRRADVPPPPRG